TITTTVSQCKVRNNFYCIKKNFPARISFGIINKIPNFQFLFGMINKIDGFSVFIWYDKQKITIFAA
ncbi:MAG: hypothetical protein PUC77_01090, partial [Bacteroidales bacterium]|nr:hypothetical protein [Bacteroidales bacterium]